MKLLKYYALMSFVVLMAYATTDFSTWEDGEGLSPSDRQLIRMKFTQLSGRKEDIPEPEKILKTMITYKLNPNENVTNYNVAYLAVGGFVCSGRLTMAQAYSPIRCRRSRTVTRCRSIA